DPNPMPDTSFHTPAEKSSAHENILGTAWDWAKGNVVDPFANMALIQPYNTVAHLVDGISGHEILPTANQLAVNDNRFLSAGWFAQTLSGGVGGLLPYIAAGKMAGGAMRGAGEALGAEGSIAGILKSEKVA